MHWCTLKNSLFNVMHILVHYRCSTLNFHNVREKADESLFTLGLLLIFFEILFKLEIQSLNGHRLKRPF